MLNIHGRTFLVDSCDLAAVIHRTRGGRETRVAWTLAAHAAARTYNTVLWSPSLSHDDLGFAFDDWRSVEGVKIDWPTPRDNGLVALFEPVEMMRSTLSFGARDGVMFPVAWCGECALGRNGAFEPGPFSLDTSAAFRGVYVHGDARDGRRDLRGRLSHHFDLAGYEQGEVELIQPQPWLRDGLTRCLFTPRQS